jgi:endonuclease III
MLIGLVVFAVASAACGIAATSLTLNLARGIQGVGGAFLLTASLAIISAEFTDDARAGAFAFWGASLWIALAIGPIIGGTITNVFGWRWIFLVNVPVCALLIAATMGVVAESRDPAARQLDFAGIVTFSLGLGLLIWGLIDGNDDGWTSVGILLRLMIAGLLFGAFVLVELRQARPMVDFSLFHSRTFVGAVLAMVGYGASAQVIVFFLPLFLQNAYGYAPFVAGIAMLPFAASMVLAPRLASHLASRFSGRAILSAGLAITGVGNLLFWAVARAHFAYGIFVIAMVVAGCGAGLLNGQTVKVLGGAVPDALGVGDCGSVVEAGHYGGCAEYAAHKGRRLARDALVIFTRLKQSVNGPVTPAKVLALPPAALRGVGLSTAKTRTMSALAEWFIAHRKLASALPALADDEVVQTLTAVPGIGPWTVNVLLIFNLGRLDVMPAADLGIRRGVQLADGLPFVATPKHVSDRSQAWRPYRSIASIYLWQATKLKLGPNDLKQGRQQ